MSLYKRGDTWHYYFCVDGRRYRGSTKQTTESRARKVESSLIAAARANTLPDRKSPTLRTFSAKFLEWVETARSSKTGRPLDGDTKRYYQNGWRLLEATPLANMNLGKITKDDVESLRFPGGPSNGNTALRTLRRMMGKAREWGLTNNAVKFMLFPEEGRERIFTPEQEVTFLTLAPQPLRDVFLCSNDAGMRPDEVFSMRIENILWGRKLIFIPRGKTTNSRRYVPMSQRLMDALWVRCGARTEGWVFPCKTTKAGKVVSASGHIVSVEKKFIEVRKAMGLGEDYVLYSARHTFGTYLYAITGNLALVMAIMGHGDIKTAMRYQHPEFELARTAIEKRQADVAAVLGTTASLDEVRQAIDERAPEQHEGRVM